MARVLLVVVFAAAVTACASIAGLSDPDPVTTIDATNDGGAPGDGQVAEADDIEVTPSEIDFKDVVCGAESANVPTFLFHNKGTKPVHYVVQVPEGSAFEVRGPAPLTGDLAPGATATFSAVVKPTVLGDNMTDVTITTATSVAQVSLKAKGTGGKLEVLPTIADFGQVRYQNASTLDVAFTNTGTSQISVSSIDGANADFDVTLPAKPMTLLPNESKNVTITMKAGATTGTAMATALVPHVDGALCGTVPSVPVKGERVDQNVTISTADFGKVYCNTSPTLQKDVVISNYSSTILSYTAALKNGGSSAFAVANAGPGTVAAGSTATPATAKITLSMKPVGATLSAINEELDIDIGNLGPPGGGPRTTAVTADIRGVVLTINPTSLGSFNYHDTKGYTIQNSGNEAYSTATVFVRDSNTTQQPAWVNNRPGSVGAGVTSNASIYFTPQYCGTYGGTYTYSNANGIPICNGTPTLHVSGRASCW